jgi:hypothetical protein
MADWISVKLYEKGMAPHQVGFKMGIAAALINAWKDGSTRPKAHHIREMVAILGKHRCRVAADSLVAAFAQI